MQRSLTLLSIAAAAMATAAPAATRSYTVTSFDRIRLEGPFEVTVRTGIGASARAEADARTLERVRLEVMGRTLVLRRDQTIANTGSMAGVRIVVTTPDLAGMTVLGAGSMSVDRSRTARFDMTVSGAGSASVAALDADLVNAVVTGAGTAKLAGRTRQVRTIVQGAGTVDARALLAQDATILTAGTGTVTLAASRTARIDAKGGGVITVAGKPACTVRNEGTVEILCGD